MLADQEEIQRLSLSENVRDRSAALFIISHQFVFLSNKSAAWDVLDRLTSDENINVRRNAAFVLEHVFQDIPEEHKSAAWDDIHLLMRDNDLSVIRSAMDALGAAFQYIPEEHKPTAWSDLHQQTHKENFQKQAADLIGSVFEYIPGEHKFDAVDDLIILVTKTNTDIHNQAINSLDLILKDCSKAIKSALWNSLKNLAVSIDRNTKHNVLRYIGIYFNFIPEEDKADALDILHRSATEEDLYFRAIAVDAIGIAFQYIPEELKSAAWSDLHRLTDDTFWYIRRIAVNTVGNVIKYCSDELKYVAWDDLHRLTTDENDGVRESALKELGSVFQCVPYKTAAWNDLHRLTNDKHPCIRGCAVKAISAAFEYIPDEYKYAAWDDLNRLITDREYDINTISVSSINSAFKYIPNKSIAWDDLYKLIYNEDSKIRRFASNAIISSFEYIPDKSAAWSDLISLSRDRDYKVRFFSIYSFSRVFKHIDKEQKYDAWVDLIELLNDNNWRIVTKEDERFKYDILVGIIGSSNNNYSQSVTEVGKQLGIIFKDIPDEKKSNAWDHLHRLINDEPLIFGMSAVSVLNHILKYIPEKNNYDVWTDLHKLTNEKDSNIRKDVASSLGSFFSYLPDKSAAWADLHRLTYDEDLGVRIKSTSALGSVFSSIPEEHKSAAWADLHKLTSDENSDVRWSAADALCSVFSFVPDKSAAWADLHRLTYDEDLGVRIKSTSALGSVFSSIPEEHKSAAWADLHRLTCDEDLGVKIESDNSLGSVFSSVPDKSDARDNLYRVMYDSHIRIKAAYALGFAFPFIPEKYKSAALDDLHRLTNDTDYYVIYYAISSLGKICIYNASKSKNEYDSRVLLEDAINYFKKAANERSRFNPARFWYPFCYSFDAILFKKVHSKKEIENFITSAKKEIRGSQSKRKLVEVVEQLAEALEIAHDAHESGGDWQETLKRCSDIFNNVEQLMNENKDEAPYIHDLYEIAKPSFDKRITALINEVKETVTTAYEEAKGTPAEDVVYLIKREIQSWSIEDPIRMNKKIDRLYSIIKEKVPDIPENRILINEIGDIKKTMVVEDQLEIITLLIMSLPNASFPKMIDDLKENMNNGFDGVNEKVDDGFKNLNQKFDLLLQTVNELKEIASKLKEEGNEKGSQDANDIADKIKVLLENNDSKEIILFIEKLREKVPTLFDEIEKSTATKDVKEKAKRGLKENIMKFGRDISIGVATNWIATYLPSIVGAGASGFLALGIILAALLSKDNLIDQGKK